MSQHLIRFLILTDFPQLRYLVIIDSPRSEEIRDGDVSRVLRIIRRLLVPQAPINQKSIIHCYLGHRE